MSKQQVEVMLDLETMGIGPNAAIVSIGAVLFDSDGIVKQFSLSNTLASGMEAGVADAATILWWLTQSEEAKRESLSGASHLVDSLVAFSQLLSQYEVTAVWGNGASFDNVILASAYRAAGVLLPWPFYLDRCFRTLKEESPPLVGFEPGISLTPHVALDDAMWQYLYLVELRKQGAANG